MENKNQPTNQQEHKEKQQLCRFFLDDLGRVMLYFLIKRLRKRTRNNRFFLPVLQHGRSPWPFRAKMPRASGTLMGVE